LLTQLELVAKPQILPLAMDLALLGPYKSFGIQDNKHVNRIIVSSAYTLPELVMMHPIFTHGAHIGQLILMMLPVAIPYNGIPP